MLKRLQGYLDKIEPVDLELLNDAQIRLDDLTKPLGSLGRLEELAAQLYCISGGKEKINIDPIQMFVVAGDHGIVAERVAPNPQDVTRQMLKNFLNNGAGINVLSKNANADLVVVDMGCLGERFEPHEKLIDLRIKNGTNNFAHEPAMSLEDCATALVYGIELVNKAKQNGYNAVAIGEMGIGNTSSASALCAMYLNLEAEKVTGMGAGLDEKGVIHKTNIIKKSLEKHRENLKTPLDILACFGGYDVCGMAGVILGAALCKIPCVIDGFIAQASFLAAYRLCENVKDYAVFGHGSAEPGSSVILKYLGVKPILNLELRLGEGTGAALAIPILRGACAMFNDMANFSQANVARPE